MSNLYFYSKPKEAQVKLKPDSGQEIIGEPVSYNGRDDAHLLKLPANITSQGAELTVTLEGHEREISDRGILVPKTTCPHCGKVVSDKPHFELDDIHLKKIEESKPPPEPSGPPSNKPIDIINWVYSSGLYNLATHSGCGLFTEACCTELHNRNHAGFGHIKKNPGQNQFNGHAVDAVSCIVGPEYGVWDIITNSVSSSAKPAYNDAGEPNPKEWYYPAAPISSKILADSQALEAVIVDKT